MRKREAVRDTTTTKEEEGSEETTRFRNVKEQSALRSSTAVWKPPFLFQKVKQKSEKGSRTHR